MPRRKFSRREPHQKGEPSRFSCRQSTRSIPRSLFHYFRSKGKSSLFLLSALAADTFAGNPIARDCSSNASLNDRALTSHGDVGIVNETRLRIDSGLICKMLIRPRPRCAIDCWGYCNIIAVIAHLSALRARTKPVFNFKRIDRSANSKENKKKEGTLFKRIENKVAYVIRRRTNIRTT